MTTETERESIDTIQGMLGDIKKIARTEMKANKELGHAVHAQAWYKVFVGISAFHADATDIGLEAFPEFFGDVITTKSGGGR